MDMGMLLGKGRSLSSLPSNQEVKSSNRQDCEPKEDTQMVQPAHAAKRLHQGTNGRAKTWRLVKEVRCAGRRNTAAQHGTGTRAEGMGPVRTHFRINTSFKTKSQSKVT